MTEEDVITIAAQHITKGDFMGAMEIFENHVNENPKDPAGYHGWAEAAMFEIQENGNFDEKGNDRINEGKVQSYLRKAAGLEPDNEGWINDSKLPKTLESIFTEIGNSRIRFLLR